MFMMMMMMMMTFFNFFMFVFLFCMFYTKESQMKTLMKTLKVK